MTWSPPRDSRTGHSEGGLSQKAEAVTQVDAPGGQKSSYGSRRGAAGWEAEKLTRKVVGVALNGNVACLRLCLDSQLGRRPESLKCWRRASRSGCTAPTGRRTA